MDPLTVLGLASNVVQFVQFTSDLIQTAAEIRRSSAGCTVDILSLGSLYGQLNDFNVGLALSHENASGYLNGTGRELPKPAQNITSFRTLSLLCKSDCEKLLQVVDKLKVQDGSRRHW